jgi:hypothetical protein
MAKNTHYEDEPEDDEPEDAEEPSKAPKATKATPGSNQNDRVNVNALIAIGIPMIIIIAALILIKIYT